MVVGLVEPAAPVTNDERELVSIVVVGAAVEVVLSTIAAGAPSDVLAAPVLPTDADSDPLEPGVLRPACTPSTPVRPTVERIARPVATRRARAAG